ncbi:acetyltransferase [Rossellomorea sp. AcN35-11]|nr:acetyltransferase [Rossellomorea aquimaris]WJV31660.1 acetyltransferase [Rossellomorea sp. AcN35-11]
MEQLVIWGCGGHAREVLHLCEQIGSHVIGFLDERTELKGRIVDSVPVLGDLNDILPLRDQVRIVCAGVGDPKVKKRFVEKTKSLGFSIADSLIHPSVHISKRNTIGKGNVICEGTIMTTNVQINDFVIVNRGVILSHDNRIHDYVTIAPGVTIAGNVTIEEGANIGIGSSIREKVTIGAWSMIGGGSFVKESVPAHTLYAGVPAIYKRRWP